MSAQVEDAPTAMPPAPSSGQKGGVQPLLILRWLRRRAAANALLLGVIALLLVFSNLSSAFLTVDNFRNIFLQSSYVSVVAVPMALLLISGRVDLSVGSVLALGAVTSGLLINDGVPFLGALLAGVLAGTAIGIVNGILVTKWDFSPIIVTLGALTAVRGLVLTIAPNPVFNFTETFIQFGEGEFLGVPYLVWVALVVFVVGAIVLSQMPVGRHIYAIGVNPEAAYLSGVRVGPVGFLLFVATGAAAGLAGVMLAARLGSAPSASLGIGFELEVLTAVMLGGVAFNGGRGTILGVFLGVLFLGMFQNGLTLENVPAATGLIVKGATLIVAAWLDRITVSSEVISTVMGAGDRSGNVPDEPAAIAAKT
jgi:ribose/xylose/arabinose/galactoside ABC-type transport system permease subunit